MDYFKTKRELNNRQQDDSCAGAPKPERGMINGAVSAKAAVGSQSSFFMSSPTPPKKSNAVHDVTLCNPSPPAIGDQIGKELRSLYNDVMAQPVPDRFLELLNRLEPRPISPETKSGGSGESE
jgi:hypothetical protein